MRAREWAIAGAYGDPADYDLPDLPALHAIRTDCGGLALAAADDEEPFIVAETPMRVRR
ncbi:hypothetical protein GCM10027435_22360 [Haloparvum alkalitolerans]|uniref:hypothetical protein n=1 Tax=Haloparvum alkalitolerans TaxID=1042953 RepID=UPI003CF66B67